MSVERAGRADWFVWRDPPAEWCREHATVPGLQWSGDGQQVTAVHFHRSHFPVIGHVEAPINGYVRGLAAKEWTRRLQAERGIALRPYQAEDLPFLVERKGALLAYEMRLGKTVPSCAAHNPNDGPLVIVAPLAAREVWREWVERVHGEPPWILQTRTVEKPPIDAGAYFVHYDILEAWTALFAGNKIGTLIIDEAHYLQNRRARRTNAMHVLTMQVERTIALTGTPMWNNPDSMYSILHLLSPGAWGSHFDYARQYAQATPGAHGWTYKGASNTDELRARLAEIMIRRTWADVAPHLPPTTYAIETVAVSSTELAKLEALAVQAGLIANTTTAAGYLATLRRKLADIKIAPAIESARRSMLDGHKVVVWVWHNEVGDKIVAGLQAPGKKTAGVDIVPAFPTFRLRAEDSGDLRAEKIDAFRQVSGPAAMVIGIAVGGVAIDLSCADHAVFAELDWTPANVHQAVMRTFHPSRPHAVAFLVADIPVELHLVQALGVREGFASSLGLGHEQIARMVLQRDVSYG